MSICEEIRERAAEALTGARVDKNAGVLCAVSGGCDSVVLMHAVKAAGWRTGAAHFDHHTRAGESAADAQFVCEMALRTRIEFIGGGWDAALEGSPSGNFEEAAREARYAFLIETAQERDYAAVATGHHADDQAETVLMRVLRGTALQGMEGIQSLRQEGPLCIVRPLLTCSRQDLEDYAAEAGLAFRNDATNADTLFKRNRIRHELLPHLREAYNPQISRALSRLAQAASVENAYLEEQTNRLRESVLARTGLLLREPFRAAHLALQRRLLAQLCRGYNIEPAFDRIEEAVSFMVEGAVGQACGLGGGVLLRHAKEGTEIVAPGAETPMPQSEAALRVPGEAQFMGRHFLACLLPQAPAGPIADLCSAARQVFDADKLGDCLSIRPWQPGDRIEALGLDGSKKLKKVFSEQGMPQLERARTPVITGEGGIAWVAGGPVAQWAAVTDDTRRWVLIEVRDAAD